MVNYFHTATYIYAVTNGYCSRVFHADGEELGHSIVGARLHGGLTRLFDEEGLKLDDDVVPIKCIKVGMYLKFGNGERILITEAVKFFEDVGSLSIPPKPLMPPETITIRDPIPTIPEILLPSVKEDDEK